MLEKCYGSLHRRFIVSILKNINFKEKHCDGAFCLLNLQAGKILQNSQENTCYVDLLLMKLQHGSTTLLKEGLQSRCFLVNVLKKFRS